MNFKGMSLCEFERDPYEFKRDEFIYEFQRDPYEFNRDEFI